MIFRVINQRRSKQTAAHRCRKQNCCAQHQELSGSNEGVKGDLLVAIFNFLCVTAKHHAKGWRVFLVVVFACLVRFWQVRLILCSTRAHRRKVTNFSVNTSGMEGEEKHLFGKGSMFLGVREAEVCSCLVAEVSAVSKRH